MSTSPFDGYLRVALRALGRRHALEILERIQPGEVGCCECGHVGPDESFQRRQARRSASGRTCPACQKDTDQWGYVDGSRLAQRMTREQLTQVS